MSKMLYKIQTHFSGEVYSFTSRHDNFQPEAESALRDKYGLGVTLSWRTNHICDVLSGPNSVVDICKIYKLFPIS